MKSKLWALVATLLLIFVAFLNVALSSRNRDLERAVSWYLRNAPNNNSLFRQKLKKVLTGPYTAIGMGPDEYPAWMNEDL